MHQQQWRATMGTRYALDMLVFLHELDRKKLPEAEYDEYVYKLSVIESAAQVHLNK